MSAGTCACHVIDTVDKSCQACPRRLLRRQDPVDCIVYLLRHEDEVQLAVYHTKLFVLPWKPIEGSTIPLSGLNLDDVWKNIVSAIGQFYIEQEKTFVEQIQADEQRAKLERQIAVLEHQMNATKQPRRKRELFE